MKEAANEAAFLFVSVKVVMMPPTIVVAVTTMMPMSRR
jgi:hypothetical protein